MRALLKIASNEFEMRCWAIDVKEPVLLTFSYVLIGYDYCLCLQSEIISSNCDLVVLKVRPRRGSVKGHKSSIKEGNALYLDGLQYSNKVGPLRD